MLCPDFFPDLIFFNREMLSVSRTMDLSGVLSLRPRAGGPVSRTDFFCRLPCLESDRLLLRPFRMKDWQDVYRYSSDPEVSRYVLWDTHRSPADSRAFLRYMLHLYHNGQPSSWAVVLKDTDAVIGSIGFMWVDDRSDSAEVGYSLSRTYWNQGLMTEALKVVLQCGFSDLRLNRIEAQHDVRNPASGKVMEKCGMRKEGILRSRIKNKNEYIDVAVWSVLAGDRSVQNGSAM